MSEGMNIWQAPPSNLKLPPGEVHIWRVNLDRPSDQPENRGQVLSQDEIDRAARFYFERDRRRFKVGRIILRNIVGLYLQVAPARLKFEYGLQGKPALMPEFKNGPDRLEFNLSNSGELALIAFTLNHPVGIDLESLQEKPAIPELVARFFAPGEIKAFRELAPQQQKLAFYHTWTCKEAFIKAIGEGFSIGLDQFEVSVDPAQPARLLSLKKDPQAASGWSVEVLDPGPGYLAALALPAPGYKLKCWGWPD